MHDGGAGARQADNGTGDVDLFVQRLGVVFEILDELQPVRQRALDAITRTRIGGDQPGFGIDAINELGEGHKEPFVAEVPKAGCSLCLRHQSRNA